MRHQGDGVCSAVFSNFIYNFQRITSTEDVIPIFLVSSVSGKNIDLLSSFLNLLTSVSEIKNN